MVMDSWQKGHQIVTNTSTTRRLVIAGGGLISILLSGFAGALVGETYGGAFIWMAALAAFATIFIGAWNLKRSFGIPFGFAIGASAAYVYQQGRYVAYLSGLGGLEMSHLVSALGEMDGSPQVFVTLFGLAFAIPGGLAGAALAWKVSTP